MKDEIVRKAIENNRTQKYWTLSSCMREYGLDVRKDIEISVAILDKLCKELIYEKN